MRGLNFKSELFPNAQLTKFERQQIAIAKATLVCFDEHGIDGTNFGHIAKEMKVSRPLISHYFKSKTALVDFSIQYLRLQFQQQVLDAMEEKNTPPEKWEVYVDQVLLWSRHSPVHARVWHSFLESCHRQPERKKINSHYTSIGQERMAQLLTMINKKSFEQNRITAKVVQSIMIGTLVALETEHMEDEEQVLQNTKDLIHSMIR